MGRFLFWLFMLATAMLVPGCMLFFGREFMRNPPKEINSGYDYRTRRSSQSQAAWDFAQGYSGQFWVRAGRITLAVSLVWMIPLFGQEIGAVGASGTVLTGLQLIPLLAVIPVTEQALKRKFDGLEEKDS